MIAAGQVHDNSKWHGIEWEFLADSTCTNKAGLKYAIAQHARTNPHHPEHWGTDTIAGIAKMPDLYIAEMVCDWKARSSEFGRDLRDWIDKDATKRFKFKKSSPIYQQIMEFVDMICEKPFSPPDELKDK